MLSAAYCLLPGYPFLPGCLLPPPKLVMQGTRRCEAGLELPVGHLDALLTCYLLDRNSLPWTSFGFFPYSAFLSSVPTLWSSVL